MKDQKSLDHGYDWKVQRYLWLATFLFLTSIYGLVSYSIFSVPLDTVVKSVVVVSGIFFILNLIFPIYHWRKEHEARLYHSLATIFGLILFLIVEVLIVFIVVNQDLSQLVAGNLEMAYVSNLTFVLPATLTFLGLLTSSYFYEKFSKLSLILPVSVIIFTGFLMFSHSTKVDSAMQPLEDLSADEPFDETETFRTGLSTTKTLSPPANKMAVSALVVSRGGTIYSSTQGMRYNLIENVDKKCLKKYYQDQSKERSFRKTIATVLKFWEKMVKTWEANKQEIIDARYSACNSSGFCEYSRSEMSSSFDQMIETKKARIEASKEVLDLETPNIQACETVSGANTSTR